MATPQEHVTRSVENLLLKNQIRGIQANTREWRVTILYYSALHAIQAVLCTLPEPPKLHFDRKGKIKHHSELKTIGGIYETLEEMSRRARYDADSPMVDNDVSVAEGYHQRILNFIRTKFGTLNIPNV